MTVPPPTSSGRQCSIRSSAAGGVRRTQPPLGTLTIRLVASLYSRCSPCRAPREPIRRPPSRVIIVVDQMRREVRGRIRQKVDQGPAPNLRRGRVVHGGRVSVLTTLTCPGHATIATGTLPSTHGIINNQWWDRDSQQLVSCSADPTAQEVPYDGNRQRGPGGSARPLKVPTFASALSEATTGRAGWSAVAEARLGGDARGAEGRRRALVQGGGLSSSTIYSQSPEPSIARYLNSPSRPGGLRQGVGPPRQSEGLQGTWTTASRRSRRRSGT